MILYTPEAELGMIQRNYFCRSIDEFLSPVDKDKYPNATQHWRFERLPFENLLGGEDYDD